MRICHFSDLHLALSKRIMPWQLASKRILGYANLRFNRGKTHQLEVFRALLAELVAERPDAVVVTGDVSNLSLGFEFAEVDRLFTEAGLEAANTMIVPGNHDRYTPGADAGRAFETGMAKWLLPQDKSYPRLLTVGPVALFGLDTAVWRNPFRAAGFISKTQIEQLQKLLQRPEVANRWPVIALHHPPFHLPAARLRDYRVGLDGVDHLIDALGDRPATLVHGHLHRLSRRRIQNLDIIGVPSASNNSGVAGTQLSFHCFTFKATGLNEAVAVCCWPGNRGKKMRFDRLPIPAEVRID